MLSLRRWLRTVAKSVYGAVRTALLASVSYDWALLDMEHATNHLRCILAQLQVYAASAITAIVRLLATVKGSL